MTTIGYSAFENCSNLATIDIPASVTSIGGTAFRGCDDYATITLNSNPYIDYDAFPNNATVTMNLTAHEGETNEYWTTFYNMNYSFEADANTHVFKVELNGDQLTLHEIENKIVEATAAVVLKSSGNPVMTKKTNVSSNNSEPNSLNGVAVPDGETSDGTLYVLNYTAANGVGFYRLASGSTVGVGKAYLTYSSGGAGAREFFSFDDEKTGIEMPTADGNDADAVVYDLQGRRVKNPVKGLYIVNGKMVIIK